MVCSLTDAALLARLAGVGVGSVCRFFAQEDSPVGKNVTALEREVILDAGLSLVTVYHHQPFFTGRYSEQSGRQDGLFCLARADDIGQPEGSTIYFGLVADTKATEPPAAAYLRAVSRTLGSRYEAACFGSARTCQFATKTGLASRVWVTDDDSTSTCWKGDMPWHFRGSRLDEKLTSRRPSIELIEINEDMHRIEAF